MLKNDCTSSTVSATMVSVGLFEEESPPYKALTTVIIEALISVTLAYSNPVRILIWVLTSFKLIVNLKVLSL